jgi:phosphoglycerol transferase MdoB-like AlkP superfamily enzyme
MTIKTMRSIYEKFIYKNGQSKKFQILAILMLSILISFILETLSRHSIIQGLDFMFTKPVMSVHNILIVFISLSLALLTSRKRFILILISTIWFILGISNFVITNFRLTPLSAMDIYELSSTLKAIPLPYALKIIILLVAVLLIIVILKLSWNKSRKSSPQIKLSLIVVGIAISFMFIISNIAREKNILVDHFDNLKDAYMEYGFAYCLTNSIFENGIKKPKDYSKERIEGIMNEIEMEPSKITNTPFQNPNIIMVQLESFFDVNNLDGYNFSENPIPIFTELKNEFSSGYLTVPSYGAGTVNTEFEVLTGMNTDYFGTGEYPYRTILQSSTMESICTNLEEFGYHSYAIHNNIATFYKRHEVYRRLGFDNFDSIEYMSNIEYNPIGWAKDKILTEEILKALNADSTKDFIYAITVQSHGEYITKKQDDSLVRVITENKTDTLGSNKDIDESFIKQLEYYVNQLKETDKFIGDLIKTLLEYREPTVVVFLGDHLPPLPLDNNLLTHNRYQTEYILWSNYPMDKVRYDLSAYQLNAYLLERVGIDNGILIKLHQRYRENPEYEKALEFLQYDMLYGKKYVYGGENPYPEKEMVMGILEPIITHVSNNDKKLYIEGENFTPWSVIYIDNKSHKTEYVNQNTLAIPYEQLTGKYISVAQVSDSKIILSKSRKWVADSLNH